MQWVAPSEKDTANQTLEKRLWEAADQLRANSGLTSAQYSTPVLGLIFLRFAKARFAKRRAQLETPSPARAGEGKGEGRSRPGPSRIDDQGAYHAEGVIYLTPNARYDRLLNLPEGENVGKEINEAMAEIEKHNPQLAGVLPRTYQIFNSTLLKELLKKVSEIPDTLEYDAFGRIYEYFLGEFARTEGQKGGEFFTPSSIVRLIVQILEPYHGRVVDPACGSGGMFVQSARFVHEHKVSPPSPSGKGKGEGFAAYSGEPSRELSLHGQERVGATVALSRMNLAVHGLEGDIREVNSYYEDLHKSNGSFDFVLANPPFNVNAVDKDRLKDAVGKNRRYPFGLPRTDNANYLWIQLFYSALNEKGRAGFVMANSASDARASEQELRKQLIESHAVDVMIAVGPNMFYTVTLPCTLWFLDCGKRKTLREAKVLFIDARHIYRQVDRAHRNWTDSQIGFVANIVRLYRDEDLDFTAGGDETKDKLIYIFSDNPKSKIENLKYKDVPGLCKAASLKEIEAQSWSLNPGRYVGVAPGESVGDEDFKEKLEELNEELEKLNAHARELEETIAKNVAEILSS